MADKTRIKVAVLEGDYADLYSFSLPLALSLQLQLQDLKLSGALWSAKASASGFSVSLYWPTTTAGGHKAKVKKPRRKWKCGKAKQQAIPSVSNIPSNVTTPSAATLATSEPVFCSEGCVQRPPRPTHVQTSIRWYCLSSFLHPIRCDQVQVRVEPLSTHECI